MNSYPAFAHYTLRVEKSTETKEKKVCVREFACPRVLSLPGFADRPENNIRTLRLCLPTFFFVKLAAAVGVNDRFTIGFSTHSQASSAQRPASST